MWLERGAFPSRGDRTLRSGTRRRKMGSHGGTRGTSRSERGVVPGGKRARGRGRDALHRRRDQGEAVEFICEGGRRDCAEPITMTVAEYQAIRADPTRFAVLRGHELPEVKSVVKRHPT